ncbi:MAG: DoxX family protein [Actinomycetota bacterium]|nr:DoxX family protein [Actinomycetota bacterium]
MQTQLQSIYSLVGRLLLAVVFLPAGLSKISGFAGTVGYITSVGMPMPTVAAALAILVEIAGGLALIFGFQTRIAALVLAAFTLVASFFFHKFWALPEAQQMMQQLMFFKNIGIVGGLLTLAAWGAGAWSLDARRSK